MEEVGMFYEAMTCDGCNGVLYYPDEVYIGSWLHNDGRNNSLNKFVRFAHEDPTNAHLLGRVPDGASVYCYGCAPKPVMI
jgi:hypothetical protein